MHLPVAEAERSGRRHIQRRRTRLVAALRGTHVEAVPRVEIQDGLRLRVASARPCEEEQGERARDRVRGRERERARPRAREREREGVGRGRCKKQEERERTWSTFERPFFLAKSICSGAAASRRASPTS